VDRVGRHGAAQLRYLLNNIQLGGRFTPIACEPLYPIEPGDDRLGRDKVAFRLNFCETGQPDMMFIRRSDTLHGSEAPMWLNTQGVME
jgi:hypothetical protein